MADELKEEEKKSLLKLPRDEQMPWALLTGTLILNACGLLVILQGITELDPTTQIIDFVASVVVFAIGGYFLHSYARWLLRELKAHHTQAQSK